MMMISLVILMVWTTSQQGCPAPTVDTSTKYTYNGDFQIPDCNGSYINSGSIDGWEAPDIEIGRGTIYNNNWPAGSQVIEMAASTAVNYTQKNNLSKGKYFFTLQYAARKSNAASHSCLKIHWNGEEIFHVVGSDYNIHTFSTYVDVEVSGQQIIILEGCSDFDSGTGMTVDNVFLYSADDGNQETVNLANGSQVCVCKQGYFDDGSGTCVECGTVAFSCEYCQYNSNSSNFSIDNFTCDECADGYFTVGSECSQCSNISYGCNNCSIDGMQCYQCINNTFLYDVAADPLQLAFNYSLVPFLNTSIVCVQCFINECISCNSLVQCGLCNETNNYFLNASTQQCDMCVMEGCLQCTSLYECGVCDINGSYLLNSNNTCDYCNSTLNYFLNASIQCQLCGLDNCVKCLSLEQCDYCEQNYGLIVVSNKSVCEACNVSDHCVMVCGNEYLQYEEPCDDGNDVVGDGCDGCVVEEGFLCDPDCVFVGTISIDSEMTSVGCNVIELELIVTPNIPIISNGPLAEILQVSNPNISIVMVKQDEASMKVQLEITDDITDQTFTILLNNTQYLNQSISIPFTHKISSIIPPIKYTEEQCQLINVISQLIGIAQIISYVVFLFSIIFNCKLIGLELFGVLQLAYLSLSQHYSWINIYLAPLLQFPTVNGINTPVTEQLHAKDMSLMLQSMQVNSLYLNNWNVMLLIPILFLLLFGGMLLIFQWKQVVSAKWVVFLRHVLKEGMITIIMFGCLGGMFFTGVQWRYGSGTEENYALSTVCWVAGMVLLIGTLGILELTSSKTVGEFKRSFKDDPMCKLYVLFTIVYRVAVAMYLALENDFQQSTLIVMGFWLLYMLYTLVCLPFKRVIQNYRSCFITLTHLMILGVGNYYRSMKSTTQMDQKSRIHTPALIMISFIIACVVISVVVLMFYIVRYVRKKCMKKSQAKLPKANDESKQVIVVEQL